MNRRDILNAIIKSTVGKSKFDRDAMQVIARSLTTPGPNAVFRLMRWAEKYDTETLDRAMMLAQRLDLTDLTQAKQHLTKHAWIKLYGGMAMLEAGGLSPENVVPCVNCEDTICHGWRIVIT